MKTQAFNITLPKELVKKVDELAAEQYTSRSDIIRGALLREINDVAEWNNFLNRTNAKGDALGITSEEQVYQIIAGDSSRGPGTQTAKNRR